MLDRTVVSWNSMITAYAQDGHAGESKRIFERMPFWAEVSWTTVMTAYAQDGDLLEAMSFFQRMPHRDVVAWTTMIRAHALKGLYRDALVLFRRMNSEGLRPDKVTLLTILESCDSRLDGAGIHACIAELGLQTDVAVGTALINMYGRCGCLETARSIFVKIEEKDVVAWTAMLNAYADNGHLRIAELMLERMPLKNSVSFNVVITAFARNGYLSEAREIFDRVTDRDAVTWTTLITAYAQQGQCKKSLELFRLMVVEGELMDRITLVSMLHVCAVLAVSSVGVAIHDFVVGAKMAIDATLGTALMNMYGKCGSIERARSQFDSTQQKDIVFWNSMIALYGQNGHGREALDLFRDMVHDGMECSDTTLGSVLSACSHSGLQRQGRDFFLAVEQDYGVSPTIEHYICIIDLLARGGRASAARELIDSMPFEPHAAAWTTFLAACKAQGKAGEAAVKTSVEELSSKVGDVFLLVGDSSTSAAAVAAG
ncbi:pentatricopeptide repeat-containing protein At4g02750-like [Selaginella moellendorffii]|uniref:pentatricopeptide repeat-containing protein At4g02750-like n=1 Tax=Selaginella moellendorffii TaxID=88036 RepID=UPI000D1C6348|nr:pentatricopeptide repeat-containing protein At4g02750-like [Selaginella moellendorffii]|eukprot:XP_024534851.1 pentatricopeptide repeat-containing protein At4g02750-like [Selaginella moellendorffii]